MKGVSTEKFEHIDEIRAQAKAIFEELMETAELEEGEILVVGCSSSEIVGVKSISPLT